MKCIWVGMILSGLVSAQVPLEQEPRHHLEFSNEFLRVISPQIPPGDTTLEHIHTHDDATVCIHGSETRAKQPGADWGAVGMVCMPGRIGITEYTGKPRSHTVENLGTGVYHLLLVENLKESGWSDFGPVTVPGVKMTRENRSFRIYETELSGSSGVPHSHAVPTMSCWYRVKRRLGRSISINRELGSTFPRVSPTRSKRREMQNWLKSKCGERRVSRVPAASPAPRARPGTLRIFPASAH